MKIFIVNAALHPLNKGIEGLTKALVSLLVRLNPNTKIVIWHTPPERLSPKYRYSCYIEGNVKVLYEESIIRFAIKAMVYLTFLLTTNVLKSLRIIPKTRVDAVKPRCQNHFFEPLVEMLTSDAILNVNYGDLFTDHYYGFAKWFLVAFIAFLVNLTGKPIIYPPQSIGPFKMFIDKIIAKIILNNKNVKLIMVREPESLRFTKSLVNYPSKVLTFLDTAFLLESRIPTDIANDIGASKNVVGFVIDPYRFVRNRKIRELTLRILLHLTNLYNERKGIVVLVPHSINPMKEFDGTAINKLIERIFRKHGYGNVFAVEEKPVEVLKGIIGMCDLIITFPTHPAIFALSEGVIPIVISYSHKAKGVLHVFGLDDFFIFYDLKELDVRRTFEAVISKLQVNVDSTNLVHRSFKIRKTEVDKWRTLLKYILELKHVGS